MTPNSASTAGRSLGRTIGKIVKSNTHYDYVCQVFCRGEVEQLPLPTDYALGAFVTIELEPPDASPEAALPPTTLTGSQPVMTRLVGVIYDTILFNPDFGSLGPRLSQSSELEIFSPDYLAETVTIVGVLALGWQTSDGCYHQGVPALAATINTSVACMGEDGLVAFHTAIGTGHASGNGATLGGNGASASAGSVCLHYVPVLLSIRTPIVTQLLMDIVDRLTPHFPQQTRALTVMRNNLAWKSIVEPAR